MNAEEKKAKEMNEEQKKEKNEEQTNYQYTENKNESASEYSSQQYYVYEQPRKEKGELPGWAKFLIILSVVVGACMLLLTSCSNKIEKVFNSLEIDAGALTGTSVESSKIDFDHDYIGVLHIEGKISEEGTSSGYNHKYLLKSIDQMIEDEHNKGIILYIDTPGGTVYGSDELYLKIKKYQEETGRPVYSSMQSQATSGGYYISAPCDKIVANRNCWTGSIGVTMGTMYDVSELLDYLGIKTQTITAGENKAMGNYTEKLTKEQQEILQSLVDEAYEQFTDIVAEGRGMDIDDVKKLADGRVYTAKQALENGLVDEIATFEETIDMMKKDYNLSEEVEVEDLKAPESTDIMSMLGIVSELSDAESKSGIYSVDAIKELAGLNGTFEISYMSTIQK